MLLMMGRWGLKGGQLAVAKDGRLVLSRSYGYADIEKKRAVKLCEPETSLTSVPVGG